jgi:hypothetical protein
MQQVGITTTPVGHHQAKDRDEAEEQKEDDDSDAIHRAAISVPLPYDVSLTPQ